MSPQPGDTHAPDTHPAASALLTESTHVELIAPATILPGQPAALTYRLSDMQTGAPVTDVVESHERPMHLIAVSRDLQLFQHVHPQPTSAAGEYRVETTFAEAGTYLLFDEFNRASGATVVQRDELMVGAPSAGAAQLAVDLSPKTIGSVRVSLAGADAVRVGQEATLTFRLEDASTGQPIRDLQPYLGAPAHGVVLSEDASSFTHTHGEAVGAPADGHAHGSQSTAPASAPPAHTGHGASAPSQSTGAPAGFGPEIALHHTFDAPGLYKLWGQFQSHDGEVLTADFVVRVAE